MGVAMKYIELRVVLKDDVENENEVNYAAMEIQSRVSDLVSDPGAPDIFTEDVTYEIKLSD